MSLDSSIKKAAKQSKRSGPVWEGPESDGPNGGITQSLLSRFLCCRERFRLLVVEGLKPSEGFNHRLEYGQMWHTCEEAHAAGSDWQLPLQLYASTLCKRFPLQQQQVEHWYWVCKTQYPIYVDYWRKQQDVVDRTPLLQEVSFKVPYSLPSGRTVYLRGKWDSVDLIGKGRAAGIYLMENKTKGQVDEGQLKRQLNFDLQTMLYLIALQALKDQQTTSTEHFQAAPIKGVRYNVIRRPLSGGKGSIVQHKPSKSNPQGETKEEYYERLAQYIHDKPSTYFMRWKCEVSQHDVAKFRRECLDPILEQLCQWWEWVSRPLCVGGTDQFSHEDGIHFRLPFGIYNPLAEGGSSEVDEYLATGSTDGLTRTDNLFPELQ